MLSRLFHDPIALGLAQAAIVTLLVLVVVLLARRESVHLERDTAVALFRGLVQIVAVGSILVVVMKGPVVVGIPLLLGMVLAAAATARRRVRQIPGAFTVALVGIGLGSFLVIVPMTAVGVIDSRLTSLLPVGSMIIASSMNACALALERFRADVMSHTTLIEAGLVLGATPAETVRPEVQAAIEASLTPNINTLHSLGIVWIPGLMAGMILSGTDPVYAAIYQFVVIAMIFAAAGLSVLIATLLVRRRVFSPADQLILRPGTAQQ